MKTDEKLNYEDTRDQDEFKACYASELNKPLSVQGTDLILSETAVKNDA